MREGIGLLITKSYKYSVEFRNDKFEGEGIYCDSEGNIYQGDWVNGMRHGTAKLKCKNGDVFMGDFIKDRENGNGQVNYADGKFFNGIYLDGRRNGPGRMLFSKDQHGE